MCGCGKSIALRQTTPTTSNVGARRAPQNYDAMHAASLATATSMSTSITSGNEVNGRMQQSTHSPAVAPAATPSSTALRYRGAQAVLVRGPVSGTSYTCYPGDTTSVHPRDVPPLVASGLFAA